MTRATHLAVLAATTVLCACGGGQDAGLDPAGQTPGAAAGEQDGATAPPTRQALEPGPEITGGVEPDQLLVRGSRDAYVDQQLEAVDARVVEEASAGLVVRVPVADVDELVAVRDRLRAVGVDARTIAVLDPPAEPD